MESNVVQKMRTALRHCIEELSPYCDGGARIDDVLEEAKSVIAIPDRNCDVGTDAEQYERYSTYCIRHRRDVPCSSDCPYYPDDYKELVWAQMPYEADMKKE